MKQRVYRRSQFPWFVTLFGVALIALLIAGLAKRNRENAITRDKEQREELRGKGLITNPCYSCNGTGYGLGDARCSICRGTGTR